MATRLNQLLGVRKSVNSEAGRTFVDVARNAQKEQLMQGLTRNYEPLDDDGDQLPSEFQKVQFSVADLNDRLTTALARMYDVNASVDKTNQTASASLKFGGNVIDDVPVTTLMWLDKQLTELASYVGKLPILDPAFDWEYDEHTGTYRTQVVKTHRSTKITKPIVLYPATEKHAAQTQMAVEDKITGYWSAQKLSGAIPLAEVRAILERLGIIREAVITAREEANTAPVEDVEIGDTILGWVFDIQRD